MTTTSNNGCDYDTQHHEFTWTSGQLSIRIGIEYRPKWHIYDHLGITSLEPAEAALPISHTGYRSHYMGLGMVEEHGGPVAVVRMLLDEAATSEEWKKHLSESRQGSLF